MSRPQCNFFLPKQLPFEILGVLEVYAAAKRHLEKPESSANATCRRFALHVTASPTAWHKEKPEYEQNFP